MNVTLELRADDAEPILRKAAYEAAKFGAWCDYITARTYNPPGSPAQRKKEWLANFLRAKRIVETFGVEYEPTSEQETLTVGYRYVGGRAENIVGFTVIRGSKPDYSNPVPQYRGEVHSQACHAAADRVVRAWRRTLGDSRKVA